MGVCVPLGTWVPGQGSRWERKTHLSRPQEILRPLLHPTPPHPTLLLGAQAWRLPRGAGGGEVGVVTAWWCVCPCGHRLLCGLVEERGACTVRWSSQSEGLPSSPAQLRPGSGPSQTWERTRLYWVPQANASSLPMDHLSWGTRPPAGPQENCAGLAAQRTQAALCPAPPAGPMGPSQPRLQGRLLTWLCASASAWLRLPGGAGQTGSRLISGR